MSYADTLHQAAWEQRRAWAAQDLRDARPTPRQPDPVEPDPCYCEHAIEAHTGPADECQDCDCEQYVEQTEVRLTLDALQVDDAFNEGRRRDNTVAALDLARRRRRAGGAA